MSSVILKFLLNFSSKLFEHSSVPGGLHRGAQYSEAGRLYVWLPMAVLLARCFTSLLLHL